MNNCGCLVLYGVMHQQGALVLTGVMTLPARDLVEETLPTKLLSSPHVAIMSEFSFEPLCLSSDWCL